MTVRKIQRPRVIKVSLTIVGLAILPLGSVLLASAIASYGDCQLHEGGVNPCVVFGSDVGGTLYSMFVMGWLGLLTLPLGIGSLLLYWLVEFVVFLSNKRRTEDAAT
ncbi:MAG: hypothetical protein AAGC71_04030 [Pseudomonadota bacterium]